MYNFEVLHLGGEGKVRLGAGGFVKLTPLVSDQFSLRSQLNADRRPSGTDNTEFSLKGMVGLGWGLGAVIHLNTRPGCGLGSILPLLSLWGTPSLPPALKSTDTSGLTP